ncbi:MAG: phenylacetate--CoA ligase family protein [Bacillota bacterium]|uniref:Phenylacetate-coenzyme A ligase n=2 Tax=Carboxydocella TaxID=178898 RepID=A0A1T4RY13_9FIRM|nr:MULTISPECIES: phenylacetate--CoA ligase [Carboxydocella]AVX21397.1 phenylacetate-CoA ligase [Carboxydocella thermautotrophica]AVX31886.1 phenylacetate-CoA ligase [Carboxydocella thermautotrophica]GAW32385.1 Phenylacetate--CoA ligase [Carboxydocella sp. JDF658]SKA20889.1 phenylacetate-CoA ligase [Carboxydocella sporoproducens DSM 16521]
MAVVDLKTERLPREELRQKQLAALQETVKRVYEKVPFYRQAFEARGITPADIRSLEDLRFLPFTTKQDLRDNYPFGLFTVPKEELVRVHASSGTTGKPTVVGYTRQDIANWAELMARCLSWTGVRPEDTIQIAYGYGLFTGGLGFHYGAERLGCTVVPISGGNSKRQIMLMQDFGTNVLACTPSYALYLAEEARELGVDPRELPVRIGIFGAEPWSNNMRKELEAAWGIKALDIYGLSEIIGPGVSCECEAQNGLHINEDYFLPEIIDPETGEVLPDGEKGELVFTTLNKEAFPVIRYRTRDISVLHRETCSCGRTFVRMERVMGRSDDMLIIRGVNVFPSQVESVLLEIGETEPHYLLVVDRKDNLDQLEIWVEVSERMFSDEVRRLEELEYKLRQEIQSVLGISARIKLVEPRTIPRSEGKAKRVVDKREL